MRLAFAALLLIASSGFANSNSHFTKENFNLAKVTGQVTSQLMTALSLDAKSEQGAIAQTQFLTQNLLMLSEKEFVGRKLMGSAKWNALSAEDKVLVKALVTEAFRVQGLRGLNLYQEGFQDLARMRLEYDYIAPKTRKRIHWLNNFAPESLKLDVKMETLKGLGVTQEMAKGILGRPMSMKPVFADSDPLPEEKDSIFHEVRYLLVPELTEGWYVEGKLPLDVRSDEIQTPHDLTISLLFIEDANKDIRLGDIGVKRVMLMKTVKSELSNALNNNDNPVAAIKSLFEKYRQELDPSVDVEQIVTRYKRAIDLE